VRLSAALVYAALLCACDDGEPRTLAECFEDEPMPLTVEVDPELIAPSLPTFTCDGDPWGSESVCTIPAEDIGTGAAVNGHLRVLIGRVGFGGWRLWVELDGAAARARACVAGFSDVDQSVCQPAEALCAASGVIGIARVPVDDADAEGIAMTVDVTFPAGERISGAFVLGRPPAP
jgi:hypothetical protein